MLGMGSTARNEVTEDSKRIIDICRDLVKRSGITNAEFYKKKSKGRRSDPGDSFYNLVDELIQISHTTLQLSNRT